MPLRYLERYECAECGKQHANGSKAQVRCEGQRQAVNDSHVSNPCPKCRLWPAWMDGRCESCRLSPRLRAQVVREGRPSIMEGGA